MNDKEILDKAIQKAIDGGWEPDDRLQFAIWNEAGDGLMYSGLFSACERVSKNGYVPARHHIAPMVDTFPIDLIFNHNFAKALWGEELFNWQDEHLWDTHTYPEWQARLMIMVISDNPIKYLGDNIL